jgi:hypothetical protein
MKYSTHMCPSLYLEDAKHTTCSALHHQLCGGHVCWLSSTELRQPCTEQWFFGKLSPNFDPENYDFDLYKGFFMKKITKICQTSKKNNSNHQIFMISSIV